MYRWIIYLLYDANGFPDYVGSTNNLKRRLKEHKKVLSFRPKYTILECGTDPFMRYHAEEKWMNHWRDAGAALRNIQSIKGGVLWAHESTRKKISAIHKGRRASKETRARMSAASKGVQRNWSEEGRKRLAKAHFKKGHYSWNDLSEEEKAKRQKRSRDSWNGIPIEQRSEMATKRNLDAWALRTAGRKSEIGQKIAATRAKTHTKEQLSEIARNNAKAAFKKDPTAGKRCSNQVKAWWASMTPEIRADYLARRTAAIKGAKARRCPPTPETAI